MVTGAVGALRLIGLKRVAPQPQPQRPLLTWRQGVSQPARGKLKPVRSPVCVAKQIEQGHAPRQLGKPGTSRRRFGALQPEHHTHRRRRMGIPHLEILAGRDSAEVQRASRRDDVQRTQGGGLFLRADPVGGARLHPIPIRLRNGQTAAPRIQPEQLTGGPQRGVHLRGELEELREGRRIGWVDREAHEVQPVRKPFQPGQHHPPFDGQRNRTAVVSDLDQVGLVGLQRTQSAQEGFLIG